MDTEQLKDQGRLLVGNSIPRWIFAILTWVLGGVLMFYGNVRYNEGRQLATDVKIEALSQRITYNDGRVAALEQRSISRQEHSDLIARMDSIDLEQKRMNDRIDALILKLSVAHH